MRAFPACVPTICVDLQRISNSLTAALVILELHIQIKATASVYFPMHVDLDNRSLMRRD